MSKFKYRIKIAPTKFESGITSCPAHVGGHLNQLWDSNKSTAQPVERNHSGDWLRCSPLPLALLWLTNHRGQARHCRPYKPAGCVILARDSELHQQHIAGPRAFRRVASWLKRTVKVHLVPKTKCTTWYNIYLAELVGTNLHNALMINRVGAVVIWRAFAQPPSRAEQRTRLYSNQRRQGLSRGPP